MSKFGNLFDDEEGVGPVPAPSKEDTEKPAPIAEPLLDEEASEFLAEKARATAEVTSRIAAAGMKKGLAWGSAIQERAGKALDDLQEAARARKNLRSEKAADVAKGEAQSDPKRGHHMTLNAPMSGSTVFDAGKKSRSRRGVISIWIELVVIAATIYWLSSKSPGQETPLSKPSAPSAAQVEAVAAPAVEEAPGTTVLDPVAAVIDVPAEEVSVFVPPETVKPVVVDQVEAPEPIQPTQKTEPISTPAAPISTPKPSSPRAQQRAVSRTAPPTPAASKEDQQVQQIRDFAKELDGLR